MSIRAFVDPLQQVVDSSGSCQWQRSVRSVSREERLPKHIDLGRSTGGYVTLRQFMDLTSSSLSLRDRLVLANARLPPPPAHVKTGPHYFLFIFFALSHLGIIPFPNTFHGLFLLLVSKYLHNDVSDGFWA